MNSNIDEKKLAEAMEKLACHIAPPGHSQSAGTSQSTPAGPSANASDDFIDENGKVHLTRMTAAGG